MAYKFELLSSYMFILNRSIKLNRLHNMKRILKAVSFYYLAMKIDCSVF